LHLLLQELSGAPQPGYSGLPDPIPHSLRKSIAVYEAGKALLAYITPEYDEIARVSICPYNMITGAARGTAYTAAMLALQGMDLLTGAMDL
jgi:ATP-dependent Zn protease